MTRIDGARDWLRGHGPGLALAGIVALAASAVAARYDAPLSLMALLMGMAVQFLSESERVHAGLDFAASGLLKAGVALLGLTVPVAAIMALGWTVALEITGLIVLCLLAALVVGRALGLSRNDALIAGGAVGICGASAALAVSSVLYGKGEGRTMATIAVATAMSTIAMVAYPLILDVLGLDPVQTGFVLGASIHDVAQVVGAGYSVSDDVGATATLVKMIRVAHLPVVLVVLSLLVSREAPGRSGVALPWFVGLFVVFLGLGAVLPWPDTMVAAVQTLSRMCFAVAIAAIGLRADLRGVIAGSTPLIATIAGVSLLLMVAAIVVALLAA